LSVIEGFTVTGTLQTVCVLVRLVLGLGLGLSKHWDLLSGILLLVIVFWGTDWLTMSVIVATSGWFVTGALAWVGLLLLMCGDLLSGILLLVVVFWGTDWLTMSVIVAASGLLVTGALARGGMLLLLCGDFLSGILLLVKTVRGYVWQTMAVIEPHSGEFGLVWSIWLTVTLVEDWVGLFLRLVFSSGILLLVENVLGVSGGLAVSLSVGFSGGCGWVASFWLTVTLIGGRWVWLQVFLTFLVCCCSWSASCDCPPPGWKVGCRLHF
jgi:hypothetical protein